MSAFRREPRYVVVKIKDIAAAGCTQEELDAFNVVCDKVMAYRQSVDKRPLGCVVVEDDWRCYEQVWSMVEHEHGLNEARKVCAEKGHAMVPLPVAGDGCRCSRCDEWGPE